MHVVTERTSTCKLGHYCGDQNMYIEVLTITSLLAVILRLFGEFLSNSAIVGKNTYSCNFYGHREPQLKKLQHCVPENEYNLFYVHWSCQTEHYYALPGRRIVTAFKFFGRTCWLLNGTP